MMRRILPGLIVGVIVLGGILLVHGADKDDRDDKDERGNKKGHQAILNAVNSGNGQHGPLSNAITALSGGHQGILDAVTGDTSSSNTGHATLQGEHATQTTAHDTLQTEHATQNTAHTSLSDKVDALQAALDALSSGGGGEGNHTLRWDQVLPAAARFVVLAAFNNEAVLDKETGLVWEQSPGDVDNDGDVEFFVDRLRWTGATFHCVNKGVGGRKGWRLPSMVELASLVDPNNVDPSQSSPALPPGHPFSNVQAGGYWSASTDAGDPARAWIVDFSHGGVGGIGKPSPFLVWCMRGAMHESEY